MFYGKAPGGEGTTPSGGKGGGRNDRMEQMIKQQQLIEQKKKEIQARLEAEQRTVEFAVGGGGGDGEGSSPTTSSTSSSQRVDEVDPPKPVTQLPFSNDGSFLEQFKRMQEEAARKKKEDDAKKVKEEPVEYDEYGTPIKNKPTIKIFHQDDVVVKPKQQQLFEMDDVPPPPPPPPPKQGDVKPNFVAYDHEDVPPPPPPPPSGPGGPMTGPKLFGFPSPQVKAVARIIAEQGDYIEEDIRRKHQGDPLMWFLNKPDSTEYKTFKSLITEIRGAIRNPYNQAPPPSVLIKQEQSIRMAPAPVSVPSPVQPPFPNVMMKQEPGIKVEPVPPPVVPPLANATASTASYSNFIKSESTLPGSSGGIKREASGSDGDETEQERKDRKRRSRWGPQATDVPPVIVAAPPVIGQAAIPVAGFGTNLMSMPLMAVNSATPLSKITRTNPQLLAYAKQAYGRIDLDEEEWKRCEEAYKMNMVFQDIARKKAEAEAKMEAGKFKYDYDSDEETDGGTWEHRLRAQEMEKTKDLSEQLTQSAKGKHHIGDFLPPEELAKFMEKYKAVKDGERLDESDYKEFKIQESNIGFKMLQKMGWSAGEGLGAEKQGISAPIDSGNVSTDRQGLGGEKPGELTDEDDEYTAYRKRMMLAYRFRPNPLNNPRRAYY